MIRYNKYKNKKVTVNGITYDSIKECNRHQELILCERAGFIAELKHQVPFILFEKSEHGRVVKYIADFTYKMPDGRLVVEDVKGVKTDVYKLKKRIMAEKYGINIKET